jgi:tetratricopeptide (TPR) repeat protein
MNIIDRAFTFKKIETLEYEKRRTKLVQKMRPNARVEIDREFSELVRQEAKYAFHVKNNFQAAEELMQQALFYYPVGGNNFLTLMEINFLAGNFPIAYNYSLELLELEFPTAEKALKMSIHCALESELYGEALKHAEHYCANWDSNLINHVRLRLTNNDRVHLLKNLFTSAE